MRYLHATTGSTLFIPYLPFIDFYSEVTLIRSGFTNVNFVLELQKYSDVFGGLGISKGIV